MSELLRRAEHRLTIRADSGLKPFMGDTTVIDCTEAFGERIDYGLERAIHL